jgi:hypothetical protein
MHRSQFLNINFLTWLLVCSAILFISSCDVGAKTVPAVAEKVYVKPLEKDFLSQPFQSPEVCNPPVNVRGIYLTGWKAGQEKEFEKLLELADNTEINAMVIDVKDNTGRMTYRSTLPMVEEIGANSERIQDIDALIKTLKQHDIYAIARVVVFEDPILAKNRPEWSIKTKSGNLWTTGKGLGWVDPYNRDVWDYILDVAEEAARKGFNEIQFDYVRFPSDGNLKNIVYPSDDGKSRVETISGFLAYANKRLKPFGVYTSADVFGLVTTAVDDMLIGQTLEELARHVDYISPMVYPSHYYSGSYGLAHPNAAPYETVHRGLSDAVERLEKMEGFKAEIRPWLQDFSMGLPSYGDREVRAQINATYDVGLSQWILWNPANNYTVKALELKNSKD